MSGSQELVLATVIPIYNEAEYITSCLESLIEQTLEPSKHMIMVLDGGSTDNSVELVNKAIQISKQCNGPEILLLNNPGKFVAEARNLALEHLPGSIELIVELIGHCTIPKDHLSKRLEVWAELNGNRNQNIAGLGIRVLPSKGQQTLIESWIEGTLSSSLGSGSGQFESFNKTGETKITAFCMHRRSALEEVGGWDTDFISCQDSDLSMRLLNGGFTLYRTNETHVNMVKRKNFSSWVKMGYRYGFWRTKVIMKHPSRVSKREFLPWFGLIITGLMFFSFNDFWLIPPMLYAFSTLFEGFRLGLQNRNITLIIGVPISLVTLHVMFSIGLLGGLFRKGKSSNDR